MRKYSIVFECSDDAAPGVSLLEARQGIRVANAGMVPRVPVDWSEACLRPYVSVLFLLYTSSFKRSVLARVICSGLRTFHSFSVMRISFLIPIGSCLRRWLGSRRVWRLSTSSCSGSVHLSYSASCSSSLTHTPYEHLGHQSRLRLPPHSLPRAQNLQAW